MDKILPRRKDSPNKNRDHLSEAQLVIRGVPQGAVLSPLLFNVMMSDLPLPPPSAYTLQYAELVVVYVRTQSAADAEDLLQPYLEKLCRYGGKLGLEFQADKSALLTFSTAHKSPPCPYC